MNKKVIYPGSFDPLTNGHLDIIKRASNMFDHIVVAVVENNSKKDFLFNTFERIEMIEDSVSTLSNVSVLSFDGL